MNLSVLAQAIYDILCDRVPDVGAEITYSELVGELGPMPPPNEGLHYRDSRLDEAFGELVAACHVRGLPAISALVIREFERNPGAGYYPTAHPAEWAQDRMLAEVAWANERELARHSCRPQTPNRALHLTGYSKPAPAAELGRSAAVSPSWQSRQ